MAEQLLSQQSGGSAGPSEGGAAPPRPPRFPAFNGLRAIAAVLVLGVHTAFVTGVTPKDPIGIYTARLEIGVSVFFLISGFLLYRPFVSAHLAGVAKPRTGAFWLRRLLRIVPAYWVALFFATTVLHVSKMGAGGWTAYVNHYLFLQIYYYSQWRYGLSQAWSLCIEMTFYLFIPLYAMAIGRRQATRNPSRRMKIEIIGLLCLVVVSFAWRIFCLSHKGNQGDTGQLGLLWLPAYLDLFACGMLLAVVSSWTHQHSSEPRWITRRWVPWVSWGLAALSFYAVCHMGMPIKPIYTQTFPDLLRQSLYESFAFFLILPAVFGPQNKGLIRKTLRWWPVASLGAISYGFYLWHEAVMSKWVDYRHLIIFDIPYWKYFAAVFVLSAVVATVSYFVIELPALRLKNSLSWWRQRSNIGSLNETRDPEDPSA